MGSIVHTVASAVEGIFGGGPSDDSDAIRDAAKTQADAIRQSAQQQIDAANAAAAAAQKEAEQQTVATQASLQQSIENQRAANLSSEAILNQQTVQNQAAGATDPATKTVEITTPDQSDDDPRNKFRRNPVGSTSSVTTGSNSSGIRLS